MAIITVCCNINRERTFAKLINLSPFLKKCMQHCQSACSSTIDERVFIMAGIFVAHPIKLTTIESGGYASGLYSIIICPLIDETVLLAGPRCAAENVIPCNT